MKGLFRPNHSRDGEDHFSSPEEPPNPPAAFRQASGGSLAIAYTRAPELKIPQTPNPNMTMADVRPIHTIAVLLSLFLSHPAIPL